MVEFDKLLNVIQILRGENGCPWDKEQTVSSVNNNLIEEAYELVEAIDNNDNTAIEEELGDLFFLVLFISYMAEQEKRTKISQILDAEADKLIRRHPHVFADTKVRHVEDVLINWDKIKLTEDNKQDRKTIFDGIPGGLPEIHKFNKVLTKIKRDKGVIPQVELDHIDVELQKYRTQSSEEHFENFMEHLLIYCHNQKIDLPKILRKLASKSMEAHLKQAK